MARQVNTKIVGTFGTEIYYKSGEEYLVRSKGNTGKQAEVAKQQAGILGKASAISAKLRAAFKPLIPASDSRKLMYRFNNILQQWIRSGGINESQAINEVALLKSFSFDNNDFYVGMPLERTASGELSLRIPAFDSPNPIYPLPFDGEINLHIIAVSCNVNDPADTGSYETVLNIHYTGTPVPSQELFLPLKTKQAHITVVAVSVNKAAVGIVGSMYN